MRKLEGKCIIWLPYFDISKTRDQGRKIPKRLALHSPNLNEVVEAAENLKLNPKLAEEKKYSKSWWQRSGYIILDKHGSKSRTLIELAKKISETRKRREISRKV